MALFLAFLFIVLGALTLVFNKKLGEMHEESFPRFWSQFPSDGRYYVILVGVIFVLIGISVFASLFGQVL